MSRATDVFLCLILTAAAATGRAAEPQSDVAPLLITLRAVGREGAGHREAMAAYEQLARADIGQLPAILAGLDSAGPLAANWIRAAADAIVTRQQQSGGKLPLAELERFVLDANHSPRARRLAFEWLSQADATAADRIIPRMLADPSVEFRRDAVERIVAAADTLAAEPASRDAAIAEYVRAFDATRDVEQAKSLVDKLTKLERSVDVPGHFGFVMNWRLIGPFDNTDKNGFAIAYPPESEVKLDASYDGKSGPVRWSEHTTEQAYGEVDLNKALGKEKGAVAYAVAEFDSPSERAAEIRWGSITANKVWLNGRLLGANEAYHVTIQIDQFAAPVTLQRGRNVILVKVCQNEQTEEWAQRWKFQVRVCDALGTAIPSQKEP